MLQQELLKRAVQALDAAKVPYVVTGSIVSSLQGEPRSTHDIDIVVSIDSWGVDQLKKAFPPPRFYLDEQAAKEEIRRQGMFNLIDTDLGDKIDFWILTEDPFDQSRFARRSEEEAGGVRFNVTRPEDTILMKLRWAQLAGGSEKQFRDAVRVYEVSYSKLQWAYLEEWAMRLDILELWSRLRSEARPE